MFFNTIRSYFVDKDMRIGYNEREVMDLMKYQYSLQKPPFTVENIDIQTVGRPKGYSYSFRNGRSKHAFIYTVSGKMRNVFSSGVEGEIGVLAGELIFIPRGSVYTGVYAEDNTTIKMIQFDISNGQLPEYLNAPVKIDIPEAFDRIKPLFDFEENNLSTHPFYYLSCIYTLLWQIDESYPRIPRKYRKLQPALAALSEFCERNEPISYYAALCDMSEVNFRRLFREYTAKSPIEYRNDMRLSAARIKLQSGAYNVTEAAEACGFSNLSFFIRLYKKKFGYTPKRE